MMNLKYFLIMYAQFLPQTKTLFLKVDQYGKSCHSKIGIIS